MDIQIFKTTDGKVSVDVQVEQETVWLSLNQLSKLFERDTSVIAKHIKNIFKGGELQEEATLANFAKVQTEGKRKVRREYEYYNLDIIISLGYRVNSKRGIEFRKWSTEVLKEYLIRGYNINQNKLTKEKILELQEGINLISKSLINRESLSDLGVTMIQLIREYAKTWHVLLEYDQARIKAPISKDEKGKKLTINIAKKAIIGFKKELTKVGEASNIFGVDNSNNLESILKNIEQTFGGKQLYPSIHLKAVNLLYFIIKDHPFTDGNKRIGSLLFLLYLQLNKIPLSKINDITLTALALLIAESDPAEKKLVINLIANVIA